MATFSLRVFSLSVTNENLSKRHESIYREDAKDGKIKEFALL